MGNPSLQLQKGRPSESWGLWPLARTACTRPQLSLGRRLDNNGARTAGARGAQAGFTLLEVVVALFIFGLLAAAGVALLSVSVRAQTATSVKFDEMAALGRLNAALSADLAQAVERPARDENGVPLPGFRGEGGGPILLGLVRRGWTNLDDAPRAELQRVDYRLDNGVLRREAYGAVDGAAPLASTEMLGGLRQVKMRYRWQGAWSDRWDSRPEAPLPQAVELSLVRRDGVPLRALFLVGTDYAPPLPEGGPSAPGQ